MPSATRIVNALDAWSLGHRLRRRLLHPLLWRYDAWVDRRLAS